MVRTHSSHTASPTRFRSPHHSPARNPSQDGSQYEMDLDALGLNSTFETTELDGGHEPPVDRVDTSDIEGPEDFTMNMTYWMTADLPLAQIKSRKEAALKNGPRMDAMQETSEKDEPAMVGAQRPTITTTDERKYGRAASERSMENDEKVRSFLSALPDTDMEGALTGTPLHAPKHSFLQVPQSSPTKARSLQPTVEDYDTPRKPTQETVIRHTSAVIDTSEQDVVRREIEMLHFQLEQQEHASKTRITELETILSYTRAELDGARTDNYRHKDALTSLQGSLKERDAEQQQRLVSAEAERQSWENALTTRLEASREEWRLQTQAKLQTQQEVFNEEAEKLRSAKYITEQELHAKEQMLKAMQKESAQSESPRASEAKNVAGASSQARDGRSMALQDSATTDDRHAVEHLSSVQTRADELQRELDRALTEVRAAREDAEHKETQRITAEAAKTALASRTSNLERDLQAARFEIECAQADVVAKQQLFNVNIDLNARLRALHAEVNTSHTMSAIDHQQTLHIEEFKRRANSLQTQLDCLRTEMARKDQQMVTHVEAREQAERQHNTAQGRLEGLETNLTMLRQQLADSYHESARARTEAERSQQDLENGEGHLREVQADASRRVAEAEKRLSNVKEAKIEAETRYKTLHSQHEDLIEGHEAIVRDLRERTEDAVRKAGAILDQERSEKRRILKDLKHAREEIDRLRSLAAMTLAEEVSSDGDSDTNSPSSANKATDAEISNLRNIIRRQLADAKSMKLDMTVLRNENKKLKSNIETSLDQQATIAELSVQISHLRLQNSALELRLEEQRGDFEAINQAMDEKLAAVVSKVMKEQAKVVVGKRDGQWAETVGRVQVERELLGKVLLRQWGREEIGAADEKHGDRQMYAYKYIQR